MEALRGTERVIELILARLSLMSSHWRVCPENHHSVSLLSVNGLQMSSEMARMKDRCKRKTFCMEQKPSSTPYTKSSQHGGHEIAAFCFLFTGSQNVVAPKPTRALLVLCIS